MPIKTLVMFRSFTELPTRSDLERSQEVLSVCVFDILFYLSYSREQGSEIRHKKDLCNVQLIHNYF